MCLHGLWGMETIKTADWSHIWLYYCRPDSVSTDLSCSLHCMPVLSVTHSTSEAAFTACGAMQGAAKK